MIKRRNAHFIVATNTLAPIPFLDPPWQSGLSNPMIMTMRRRRRTKCFQGHDGDTHVAFFVPCIPSEHLLIITHRGALMAWVLLAGPSFFTLT